MRIILLGAPGAGKGTVAKALMEFDRSVQISTGDILRNAVKAGTEMGKRAQGYMERGELVPDSLIMEIMESRLQEPDCEKGFILDGFPRTIPQAEALKNLLQKLNIRLDLVVNLHSTDDCSTPMRNLSSQVARLRFLSTRSVRGIIKTTDQTNLTD